MSTLEKERRFKQHQEFERVWDEVQDELKWLKRRKFTPKQMDDILITCQHVAWRVFRKMRPQRN